MSFLDLFSGKPSEKAIQSQKQKAKERYAQPEYRRMAMEKLLKWDTEDSIAALLERWAVVVQSPHWDEDEKSWLVTEIVSRGERVKPILRTFILNENAVNYALIAYRKLCETPQEFIDLLFAALQKRPPSDHRSVQSKQELIAALAEANGGQVEILLPYLRDHSDDVRCTTIDAISSQNLSGGYEALAEMLNSDSSSRVLRHAASAVEKLNIPLNESTVLAEELAEDFHIVDGQLKRKH